MFFWGICFVLGALAMASNPSSYYGVMGLVVGSVVGCGWLVSLGASFISLVLFLVYLGGMLVVFVYLVSLVVDPYPETWGDMWVLGYGVGFVVVILAGIVLGDFVEVGVWGVNTVDCGGAAFIRVDFSGVAVFYSWGMWMFMVAGWGLLLTLFVVLELVRGMSYGTIQAV